MNSFYCSFDFTHPFKGGDAHLHSVYALGVYAIVFGACASWAL